MTTDYSVTKGAHALVSIEARGHRAVVDPGVFASDAELDAALDGASLLLITHVHPDHIDVERVAPRIAEAEDLRVLAPAPVLTALLEAGVPDALLLEATGSGDREVGGFRIREHGGQHALIHLLIPLERNVGYFIDELIFHPGDALSIPPSVQNERLELLLVPTYTPWARASEVGDFVAALHPVQARPIHNGPFSEQGSQFGTRIINNIVTHYDTAWEHWADGDSLTISA
jgi:L-ascorbate metabolism protein UlaG (beta-lactamase superfamily)